MKRICIVGSGFGGFEAALQLDDALKGRRNVEVVLISDDTHFTYRPLLPDVATGSMSMRSVRVRLAGALDGSRCQVIRDRIEAFDLEGRRVIGERKRVDWDYLLIAVGSAVDYGPVEGGDAQAMTLRTVRDAMRIKGRVLSAFRRAHNRSLSDEELSEALTFAVVGESVESVELTAELASAVRQSLLPRVSRRLEEAFRVVLITPEEVLLQGHEARLKHKASEVLERLGVEVLVGEQVVSADGHRVELLGGRVLECGNLLWMTGRRAPEWLEQAGVPVTEAGYIPVLANLEVEGLHRVFAAGSCAEFVDLPGVGDGRASSREGELAAANIIHDMVGSSHERYAPRWPSHAVALGRLETAGRSGGFSLSGLMSRGLYRAAHVAQAPTLTKKLAIFTDWTDKMIRGRDWKRLPLRE